MKRKSFRGLASALSLGALSAIVVTGRGHAATYTKADNTNALNLGTSWGGTAPGAADTANWAGTYNTAGSLSAALPGSALTWQGLTVGSLAGTAAGTVSIGGTGAPVALSALTVGSSGVDLTGASHDAVINAETFRVSGSQTWTIPTGRNLRFGSNVATANVDGAGGDATVVTVTGGGTLDGNQGAANGFADYTGKWVVEADTMLRGIGTGTAAWGSNAAADAITLKGGTLAVGAISGAAGTISWPNPITLGAATSSRISRQYAGGDIPDLTLGGAISGDGNLAIDKLAGTFFNLRVDRVDNSYTGTTSIINSGTSGALTVAAHLGTAAGAKTPFGTGAISVTGTAGATAALEFTTTAVSAVSNAESIVANNISLDTATLRTREGLLRLDGSLTLSGANTIQGQVDLRDITINGLIEGPGSVNFRATGAQKIKLPGANTYSGGTILGSNSASVGVVVLGDANALGTGTITARGMQIWSEVDALVLANNILVGNGATGGLCFGGTKNISLAGSITLTDSTNRQFQNSGTGMITLAGISMTGSSSSIARFNESSATQGAFTVAGPITGLGQVQIRGGIVTLAGANTYTGNTTVSNAGRLNLTGSLTSNVTMSASGAALMGSGSTTGNLTVSAGTIYLDPANPSAAISAKDVSITGATKVELLAPQPLGTTIYTVLNYTGTFTGLANLSTSASRGTFSTATPGTLNFVASSATRTWNAAATTVWNTTDLNWAEGDQKFYAGDAVVFGDTGAGSLSITGVVRPLSATFNNSIGSDYTLTATAGNQLGGPGGLEKTGTGTLTLVGPNTFTGKTILSGGTLVIREDAALGTAPAAPVADQLTLAGGTLKLAPVPEGAITLQANRGITLAAGVATLDTTAVGNTFTATISGATAGAGEMVIFANGDTSLTGGGVPGATHLSGASLRTGSTTIKTGVVAIESGFGDPNAVVILDGGGLVDRNLNVTFTQPLQVGSAGGILRSYGTAATAFSGSISNAPGVASASLTHTDGGTQTFNGDGSAFQGTYTNARGNANFDSDNWAGMNLVHTDADIVRFRSGTLARVNSVTLDRDLHIEQNTTLDVVSGSVTVAPGLATQNFWIQNTGTLTSSSGALTFDFQTPYTTAGAEDQAVRVVIADSGEGAPLTVVKNGPGAINTFDQSNTYTGGTVINGGKINIANVLALGFGPVTVNSGGQASFTVAAGTYVNDFTIAGIGPAEPTGNLGAIRFANNSLSGALTVATAGARVVADAGTTGGLAGTLAGGGNLELNSPAAGHTGTFNLSADGTAYTGTLTLAQGALNLSGTVGGSVVIPAGTSLAGEGAINGKLTLGGTLRVAGASPEVLTVNELAVPGPCLIQLDSLPVPLGPITILNYTTLTGAVANFQNAPGTIRRLAFTDTGSSITGEVVDATRTWTGAANGNWDSTSLNWVEGDQKFTASDSVVFNNSGTTKTILIANPVLPSAVLFDNSTGNDYAFTGRMEVIDGGALVKQGTGTVTLAGTQSNVTGAVRIDGGTLVLATTDYQVAVGASTGIEINAGGTLRLNGINILGNGVDSTSITVNPGGRVELNAYHTHFRTLNLKGGAVLGTRPEGQRYEDEYATFDALVTVSGSQMSTIGSADGGTGSYSLSGGTFDVGEVAAGTDLLVNSPLGDTVLTKNGPGTMTLTANNSYTGNTVINNGTLDIAANGLHRAATGEAAYNNTAVVTVNATGTLKLKSFAYNGDGGTGGLADYAARRVLNAGTIEVTGPTHSSGNDFAVTAAGGTFRYQPAATGDTLTLAGNANTNIELGGILTCDTIGNLTIGEIVEGAGSVRKTGAGALTLNATNTYTGMTTVVAGALKGTGSIAGGLTVNATGTIAPGVGVGTFTVSGATSLAGTYACEISGAAADRLTVTGNLSIAASGTTLAFSTVGGPTAASYVIASYTGTFSGNLANLTVTGLPSGYSVTHDAGAKQLKLIGSPSGYGTWAATNGIGAESPATDHDKDGMANAVEWVLGGNPNGLDSNKLPLATTPAGDFVFTFKRAQASKTADTAVVIEVGTTLTAWPSLYTVGNTTAGSTTGVTVTDNGDGTDTVQLTVTRAPNASKFARLRVTIN